MTSGGIPSSYEEFVRHFVEELVSAPRAQPWHRGLSHLRFSDGVKVDRGRAFTRISTGRSIILDVTLEAPGHPLWVFECKDFGRQVEIGRLDEFVAKLRDLRGYAHAHKGVIVTRTGFQKGTEEAARALGLGLWIVRPAVEGEVYRALILEDVQATPPGATVVTQGTLFLPWGRFNDGPSRVDSADHLLAYLARVDIDESQSG